MRAKIIEVRLPETDYSDTNDNRADMVRPFVEAYERAYYRLEEAPATVLTDMIANLLHLADRTEREDPYEPILLLGADDAINQARFHYDAEVAEEQEEAEWKLTNTSAADVANSAGPVPM